MILRTLLLAVCLWYPIQAHAFPDNGVLDDFNRANGAIGSNWTSPIGLDEDTCSFNVVGNGLTFSTSDTFWCRVGC